MYNLSCSLPFQIDQAGQVICPGDLVVNEAALTISQLTGDQLGLLLSGGVGLLVAAYCFNFVGRFIFGSIPGRG